MSFEYKNNSLLLSGGINADDYNEVINFYSQISPFQYQNYKSKGDRISAIDWQDLSDHVQALRNQNYTIPWVPSGFVKGNRIQAMSWSNAIYRELKVPGNYIFQAPNESRSIQLTWLMAGGGAGGGGSEAGFGASGGGGGSGGYRQNTTFSLTGGETVKIQVGAGGNPTSSDGNPIQGGSGGDTVLFINDVEIARVTGGGGGENASSAINKHNPSGGSGGNPNGLNGTNGLWANNNDYLGGAGGNSPFGNGGQSTWNNVGENGSGYGAGGGGGCTKDRQSPNFWPGGYGGSGYTLFNLTN